MPDEQHGLWLEGSGECCGVSDLLEPDPFFGELMSHLRKSIERDAFFFGRVARHDEGAWKVEFYRCRLGGDWA